MYKIPSGCGAAASGPAPAPQACPGPAPGPGGGGPAAAWYVVYLGICLCILEWSFKLKNREFQNNKIIL